jgi:hypothetical protein
MTFRTTTAFLLILFCVTLNATAQSTGQVTGRVLDQTGASLPGVAIDLIVDTRKLTAYWADWDATDQVPARAIARGLISRFGVLDPSDGGQANRQSLAADVQRSHGPSSWRATGFLLRNSLNLFSNFTCFLDDTENGDQFEQAERRIAAGGRVTYRRLGHLFDRLTESAVGVQVRRDWLDLVGLYRTRARQRFSTTREDEVGQAMAAVYAHTDIEWTRAFRTTFGLRADRYQFSVTRAIPSTRVTARMDS